MRDEERNFHYRGSKESNVSRWCALKEKKNLYNHQEQYCYAVDRYMCA